jgi:hypothetical protein
VKTDVIKRRMDHLEGSLAPREAILLVIEKQLAQFDSLAECDAWLGNHPGELWLADLRQVQSEVAKTLKKELADVVLKAFARNLGERACLAQLWLLCNQHVVNVTQKALSSLSLLVEKNCAAINRLRSRRVALELLQAALAEPFPLDSDEAAALQAAADHHVQDHEALLSCILPDRLGEDPAAQAGIDPLTALDEAVRALIRSGEIAGGAAVGMGPIPHETLLLAPLIDGQWIDPYVVELAEFGAVVVDEQGLELRKTDCHRLAQLQICRRAEAGQLVAANEKLTDAIRADVRAALAQLEARTKQINGRSYLHIDDYRAWPGRKLRDDLRAKEMIVVSSWNAWVDRHGGDGEAELAGIRVRKLRAPVDPGEFIVCPGPEEARMRRRQRNLRLARIHKLLTECQAPALDYGQDIIKLLESLFETRFAISTIQDGYFDRHELLFRQSATQLDRQIDEAEALAVLYNQLVHVVRTGEEGAAGTGQLIPIDVDQIKRAAENAGDDPGDTLAGSLVRAAKAAPRAALANSKQVQEILNPFLKEVEKACGKAMDPHDFAKPVQKWGLH